MPGTLYRVYESLSPIQNEEDLAIATLVATLGDSTWCDRRLSSIVGTIYGYAADSLAPPLGPTQGLCVLTPDEENLRFYAVTAQRPERVEERVIVPGGNALVEPVAETPVPPRPVYQRTITQKGVPLDIYTLWTSDQDTPFFPAMANRPSLPFDCCVLRAGTPGRSLMIKLHARGTNFMRYAEMGSGMPGEWSVSLDDPLDGIDVNTFWYGYHSAYRSGDFVPSSGRVEPYTLRRMIHTVEWARRTFPIDTTQVYVMGNSMGAIGAVLLANARPDLVAAIYAVVPHFDFSFLDDPVPGNFFNSNGSQRVSCDRLWGAVPTNLPTDGGEGVYDRLNAGTMALALEAAGLPPIIAYCGRNDIVVGWAEKIPYLRAVNEARQGGIYFWDRRDHAGNGGAWAAQENPRDVYKYRTNWSYPAFSNGSADGDPGSGDPASGDSVGTINGFLQWDPFTITDDAMLWKITLRPRDLAASWGVVPAPASVTVDVTPRRLQSFQIHAGDRFYYLLRQSDTWALKRTGVAYADSKGLLTIPAVAVPRLGIDLSVVHYPERKMAGMGATQGDEVALPRLSISHNPLVGSGTIRVMWPGVGDAQVDLIGVSGRLERHLWKGSATGLTQIRLDAAGLPAGVYFVSARQSAFVASERVVVLP